jgi:hypothetical protein
MQVEPDWTLPVSAAYSATEDSHLGMSAATQAGASIPAGDLGALEAAIA